jgi:hypothetical protein
MKVFGFAKLQWHLPQILNFEFFFLLEIQLNYQKNGFGKKKWITNSHSGQ